MPTTYTPTPDSLSDDPTTAAAQLDIRIERTNKARAEQQARNAWSFEERERRLERCVAYFKIAIDDDVKAYEMAVQAIDEADIFNENLDAHHDAQREAVSNAYRASGSKDVKGSLASTLTAADRKVWSDFRIQVKKVVEGWVAKETRIATHQDTDSPLNGPNGTAHQQGERTRSNLWRV